MIQICMEITHELRNTAQSVQKCDLPFYTDLFSNLTKIQNGGFLLRKTYVLYIFAWEFAKNP